MVERGGGRWVIVLGLAFVFALVVALLILWLYEPSQQPQQPQGGGGTSYGLPGVLAEASTGRQHYPAATELARSWQPDARVAIISAHWRTRQGQWSSDVTWTFQFYSPETRRVAVIIAERGQARLLRETVSPYVLPTFDEADWKVSSRKALDTWWRAGGAVLMSIGTEADLTAQLRVLEEEDDRLAWVVTGVVGKQVRRLVVDGRTGEQVME